VVVVGVVVELVVVGLVVGVVVVPVVGDVLALLEASPCPELPEPDEPEPEVVGCCELPLLPLGSVEPLGCVEVPLGWVDVPLGGVEVLLGCVELGGAEVPFGRPEPCVFGALGEPELGGCP
jgi:hypothetical protein